MPDLTFDHSGFGTTAQRISWQDLVLVGLRTTADGPFAEDVFWQFVSRHGFLEVPGPWIDREALDELYGSLPGLDSAKILQAMGSTAERQFVLWQQDAAPAMTQDAVRQRFAALGARLGASGDAIAAADRLFAAWAEPARRYHDLQHLADCLHTLDSAPVDPADSDVLELALWFHDAVYDPSASDSEARSAALLAAEGAVLGMAPAEVAEASRLVCATAHGLPDRYADARADVLRDVDLAILASHPLRFLEFEHGVAEEYAAVSHTAFIVGRGRFLAGLLARRAIFRTAHFHNRFEAQARSNLAALLASPRYRLWRVVRWLPLLRR